MDATLKVFQIMGGFGSFILGISVFLTFAVITLRQRRADWLHSFLTLYEEFWKDPTVSKIRRCVISNIEYEKIRIILDKRNASLENTLDENENFILDEIDRFCSLMVRINSFSHQVDEYS